jgi:hypothetical protein
VLPLDDEHSGRQSRRRAPRLSDDGRTSRPPLSGERTRAAVAPRGRRRLKRDAPQGEPGANGPGGGRHAALARPEWSERDIAAASFKGWAGSTDQRCAR